MLGKTSITSITKFRDPPTNVSKLRATTGKTSQVHGMAFHRTHSVQGLGISQFYSQMQIVVTVRPKSDIKTRMACKINTTTHLIYWNLTCPLLTSNTVCIENPRICPNHHESTYN